MRMMVRGCLVPAGVILAASWPLPQVPAAVSSLADEALESLEPSSAEPVPEPTASGPSGSAEAEHPPGATQMALEPSPLPPALSLAPGEVRSLSVDGLTRVVIGDPEVADVSIVSVRQLLLQALKPGATNLILWDSRGQHAATVEVIDRSPEVIEAQLRQLIQDLNLAEVQVAREQDKIFVSGEVPTQAEADRIEQMLSAYTAYVTNLVSVRQEPPPVMAPPATIELTVQLIEMTREGKEQLGVDWADKLTFTETTFDAPAVTSDLHERVDEAFRFGALKRSALTPTLNMLVSQGKARILTEPKLVAASGKEATAFLGVEVPVITATSVSAGTVTQQIEFKKTGVEMKFTPTLLDPGDDTMQLVIDAKVSSVDKAVGIEVSGITVPGFRVRHTTTDLVTHAGESVLISGLLQDEEKRNLSQVPGIGSVPVLGSLFRSREFQANQTELIIVVTPELAILDEHDGNRASLVEQALASAELAGAVTDPMLRYALQVQERIAGSLQYPEREKDQAIAGEVKLRLHLLRDGTLEQAIIAEPSGIDVLDAEALKVAEHQSPYPPFPSDVHAQDLWLEVPVLFRP